MTRGFVRRLVAGATKDDRRLQVGLVLAAAGYLVWFARNAGLI